eukprot:NODE_188_length_15619_cov_0.374871.p10 type:complete len:126 gc:universal NODE_188_length_15619_cov_0.374871:2989-3366(+)
MMSWLDEIKKDSKVRQGYCYPLGAFKDNIIAFDMESFVKMMNCSFSDAFKCHATKTQKGNIQIDTTNIRTDGYSVQFVKKHTNENPSYVYQYEWYNKKKESGEWKSKASKADVIEDIKCYRQTFF